MREELRLVKQYILIIGEGGKIINYGSLRHNFNLTIFLATLQYVFGIVVLKFCWPYL